MYVYDIQQISALMLVLQCERSARVCYESRKSEFLHSRMHSGHLNYAFAITLKVFIV